MLLILFLFFNNYTAFAWLKCNGDIEDCEQFLKDHKIMSRGGRRFGSDPRFSRVSMLSRDEVFEQFLNKLLSIKGNISNGH